MTIVIENTDIVTVVNDNPGIVLLNREKFDAFYEKMKAETDKLVPDTSTTKGRDEIRSTAARVVRAKTAIDKARLGLTAEWRENVKRANDAGKEIEERLTGLADEVRAPLTAWEEAEKARIAECQAVIDGMRAAKVISEDDTADSVRARGTKVYQTEIDPDRFGDLFGEATQTHADAVDTLKRALARLTQEEADRAELAKLRAEREEADRVAAEKAAIEEAERQRVETERLAEERRVEAERVEAERFANAEKAAAERARIAAEEAAQADRDRVQREHDAALAAERARAEQLARDIEQAAAMKAHEDAEQAKREANVKHRTAVKTKAKQAIMTCGASEETAQKIVLAIIAGEIPAVSLAF